MLKGLLRDCKIQTLQRFVSSSTRCRGEAGQLELLAGPGGGVLPPEAGVEVLVRAGGRARVLAHPRGHARRVLLAAAAPAPVPRPAAQHREALVCLPDVQLLRGGVAAGADPAAAVVVVAVVEAVVVVEAEAAGDEGGPGNARVAGPRQHRERSERREGSCLMSSWSGITWSCEHSIVIEIAA